MIKNILFDFDGTLLNTNDVVIESFQHTYEHFLGHRVPVSKITSNFGELLQITLKREIPDVDTDVAVDYYRTYQVNEACRFAKEFPGVREMLEVLKEKGFRIAIVTSRTAVSTWNFLKQFGLTEFFDEVISCDDTVMHKPDPAPILCALSKLGAEKDESIMIGDGAFDIKCANNAGVKSALVGWRITGDSNPLVKECEADYEVETPADVISLVENIQIA